MTILGKIPLLTIVAISKLHQFNIMKISDHGCILGTVLGNDNSKP